MNNSNKIDVDKIDLDELKKKTSDNPGLLSFPHTVGGSLIKPEDEGRIKSRALSAMKEQTDRQLKQLYEQMQTLVRQANNLKNRVEVSERIYLAEMSFEPIVGEVYFLYEKKNGSDLLSLVGPNEWGIRLPYKSHIASVRLLSDHTWEVLEVEEN